MTGTTYPTPDPILTVEHLTMRFGGLVAIGDVTFSAQRGEITALIGPNGAGKTTVFNCITGFYKPTEGMLQLALRGGEKFLLERLPGHEINAKAKVARTFQNIRLFSGMTVLENLLVAQHNKLMKASGYTILGLLGAPGYKAAKEESMELAKFWLDKADLTRRADEPAGSLPYGDQRRLEIARAMCTGPELLCLDEPAAGLNPKESLALNTLLLDIKKSTSTSILLIEHDMSVVMQISDHVVVLEYGRKISDGDPSFVKSDPRVIAAYLGVEDEEVEDVLVQVGDENVIESLDAEPDREHGPGDSASMMAGPISDTVGHSDPDGETLKVSQGASRAALVDARLAKSPAKATPSAFKTTARTPAAAKTSAASKAKVAAAAPMAKNVPTKAAAKPAQAEPTAAKAGVAKAASTSKAKASAKPAPKAKPAPAAAKAAAKPVAKSKAPAGAKAAAKPTAKPKGVTTAKSAAKAKPRAAARPAVKAKPAPAAKPAAKPAGRPAPKASASKPVAASPGKPKRTSNWLAAPRGGRPDDLLLVKGIGPVNKRKLNEHGIFHFDQIAAWNRADIAAAEAYLEFDGRIDREDWIGQAKTLGAAPKSGTKPAPKPASKSAAKRGGK